MECVLEAGYLLRPQWFRSVFPEGEKMAITHDDVGATLQEPEPL